MQFVYTRPGHKMLKVLSKVAPILVKSCLKVATFSEKLPRSCQFCQKLPTFSHYIGTCTDKNHE